MAASATSGVMAWIRGAGVGAGVVAAIGAGAVYFSGIRTPDTAPPAPVQVAQPTTGAETPRAGTPEPAAQATDSGPKTTVAADPELEDMTAVEPQPLPPASETKTETPPPTPDLLAPRFDVVRVDPQGNTVIAGTGTPGARVTIYLDGKQQVSAVVDRSGAFVSLLSVPPSDKPRVLTMVAELDNARKAADDQIILAPTPGAIPEPEPKIAQADTETAEIAAAATGQIATEQPADISEIELAEAETDPVEPPEIPATEAQTSESPATETATAAPVAPPAANQAIQNPPMQTPDSQTEPVIAQTDVDKTPEPQQQDTGQGTAQVESESPAQPTGSAADAPSDNADVINESIEVAQVAAPAPVSGAGIETAEQPLLPSDTEMAAETVSTVPGNPAGVASETTTESTVKTVADPTTETRAATSTEVIAETQSEESPPGLVATTEAIVKTEAEPTAPTATEPVIETAVATAIEAEADAATNSTAEAITEAVTEAITPKVASVETTIKAPAEVAPEDVPVGVSEEPTEPPVQIAAEPASPGATEPTVETVTEATTETTNETAAATETTAEPVTEPATETVTETTTETAVEAAAATATETTTEPVTEPASGTIAATEPTTGPVPAPVTVLRAGPDGIEVLQSGSPVPEVMDQIALDTISYSQAGEVQLSGRAQIQSVIRVYLDNKAVGDLVTDPTGRWSGDVEDIEPGIYTLRLDELGPDGQVLSRIETPFKREAPEVVRPTLNPNTLAQGDTADGGPVPLIRAVTVQRGDTLWAISRERYGEGVLYVRVFEANRGDIRDPDLIYPGQVFTLPE